MNKQQVERWIKEKKADNLSLIEEYSDTIEKGRPIRFEIANAEVTPETYQRKDAAKVYFSKGKQTYQKDIKVPDFLRKPRSEVETWAKNNEIDMTYEEKTSNDIPADSIMEQSIAKDEKIAKKEKDESYCFFRQGLCRSEFFRIQFRRCKLCVGGSPNSSKRHLHGKSALWSIGLPK